MTSLRTVFMGSPELAVPSLRLLAARTQVGCVVTQPDRPAGRGRRCRPPPIKQAAQDLGLPVWQPDTLRGAAADPHLQGADLFIVLAYGEILHQDVLDLPAACVNLHGSLLPRWRGASPLQACLRAGDEHTGVSVMRMVRRLDAGPVYLQREIELGSRPHLPWLHDQLAELAAEALADFLDRWPDCEAENQDESAAISCGKLGPEDGHLDFSHGRMELDRWIRAYNPVPGTWCLAGKDRLRIIEASPCVLVMPLEVGHVHHIDRRLYIGCGDGALEIHRLQPAGKRAMDTIDYLNGHQIPERVD